MTARGDARRARLGADAVDAAHRSARNAPPWTPAVLADLMAILRTPETDRARDNHTGDAA